MPLENIINNEKNIHQKSFLAKLKDKITPYVLSLSILAGAYFSCNLNPIEPPVERKETRLNFDLKIDKDKYEFITEPVNIEYTVKNIGSDDAVLEFNEPNKKFNYNIHQGNKFIYSGELAIDSLAQLITSSDSSSTFLKIKPDETVTFKGTWDQHLTDGRLYYVSPDNYDLIVRLDNLRNKILERNSEAWLVFQINKDYDLEGKTKIAFTSNRDGNYNIYTINPDRSGLKQLTNNKSTWWPSWSPDGKKIAYSNNNEIWIMNSDGTNQTYLTYGRMPAWSPDGEHIVYVKSLEIYTINLDGGGREPLVVGPLCESPSWSPDGTKILLHQLMPSIPEDPVPKGRILMMDIQNKNYTGLDSGFFPSWSPNGKKIIYVKFCSGYTSICEMDFEGNNKKELWNIKWNINRILERPTLSPDGKEITYSDAKNNWWGSVSANDDKIWIMNSNGTNKYYLTDGREPAWSPFLK